MEGADIPTFGEALARFRTRAGLSQQRLAKQLGKNRRAIAAWEAGDYLPKTRGDVLELTRLLHLDDGEAMILLKAAGIDPRLPIWNIPFPRNPFFTGRDQELTQLHTQLRQGTTAVVEQGQSISGLGGIGKTQLAVEYAYRYQDEYQSVLWARAENVAALTSSFSEIARLLFLPEKDEREQAITILAVKRWLQRQRGWLLILDNADTPGLLPDFLPSTIGGHLLITTRAADLSAHLSGLAHPLVVDTFSDEQGAFFLLHRSGLLTLDATLDQVEARSRQLAREIAYELGGLPLALDQVGAYLKATGCSLAVYQQIYKQRRAQLLGERRGAEHPEPVATTWNISFQNIEQQNPAAGELLRMMAFLAPDAIPEVILTDGVNHLGPLLAPVAADAYLLNAAIEDLRAYSLIARDPYAKSLAVHRLVQVVLRESLSYEAQQLWMGRAVRAMVAAFPGPDFPNWMALECLLPHMLTCAAWIKQASLTTPEASLLLTQAAYYLLARARYGEAESLYQHALQIDEQQLGLEHPDTALSLNNMARLYQAQGKYARAEPLYQRALQINEQEWGTTHPDTARSLNNLATLYVDQGRYREAEPLYERSLAIREQQLGPEHPDTAQSLNNLAHLYHVQGKYEEAEPLLQRVLQFNERQLGPEHPDTAQSLNNLAELYRVQGKYTEAEPLYKRALAIRERQLGPEHPDTALILNNLALLYQAQGKYARAEPLYKRALAIRERQLGVTHPSTALSLNNLAYLYQAQGRYAQAEPLYQRALQINEQQLRPDHPNTASILNNLAFLYQNQGKYEQAKPLYERAISISEQQLGVDHPQTRQLMNNYLMLLSEIYTGGHLEALLQLLAQGAPDDGKDEGAVEEEPS